MRKIIYSLSVSLDGFVEDAEKTLDWVHIDEEIHAFFNEQSEAMDAFLYGRTMYELMSAYWPTADANPSAEAVEMDFSRIWKQVPKLIFSDTLEHVEWNSRLLRRDDLAETVKTLKAQPGRDMGVGGPTLAGALIRLGLVDEFHLMVNPVVLGRGTPYFPRLDQGIALQLVESRPFSGGVMFLRYVRASEG